MKVTDGSPMGNQLMAAGKAGHAVLGAPSAKLRPTRGVLRTTRPASSRLAPVRKPAAAALLALSLLWGTAFAPRTSAVEPACYQAPASHRVEQTINRGWTFNYFPAEDADHAGCQAPAFDDSTWPAVAAPHTWQTFETTGKLHPFICDAAEKDDLYWWSGWGWYRKHFSVTLDQAGRKVFVEFDGVQKYSKVWLNGQLLGDHKGGYAGFEFDITDGVRFGEDNVLVVAVNNRQNDPFKIPPMSAGNFDVYGGIYRDVRLVIKDRLYIPFQGSYKHQGGTFVTTPKVSAAAGEVRVQTWVQNANASPKECELRTTITDADGKTVQVLSAKKTIRPGELAQYDQTSQPVASPRLWSPDTPYLYKVCSDVFDNGAAVDHFESPLGFREYKWDYSENRLILNGKKVVIHGSNRHQEYPWLGDATPKWLHLLDMRDFKLNLNHNFMRTAHYPQDSAIYSFCDQYGIIVIEELPNIKRQKFSEEVQVQQLREAIRRDRNHPSIFFWSMGNETDHAVDSKFAVQEDTTRIIHGREIYNDSGGKYLTHTQKQLALESLLRCTIRGWYNADVHNLEPESVQHAGHETWQHDLAAAEIVKRNKDRSRDDMANINTWLYADHGCDRDYANCPLKGVNPKGWVDCWRTPKYMYYLWQAVYSEKPMAFIHPHFWRTQYLGQKREIVVDSNCDSVELKVNGRSVGTLKPCFEEANVVRFKDVPVEPGVLSAEARKGTQVVTAQVVMAGAPARLSVTANPGEFEAALDSVAIVRADILDANGNHVYGATNSLQWSVSGPATLVGPPAYSTDTDKCEATQGTMYIDAPAFNVIRSTGKPGQIKLRVRSPGLAPAEVVITAAAPAAKPTFAIIESPLPDGKRQPVAREGGSAQAGGPEGPEMKDVSDDLQFQAASLDECSRQIDAFLRGRNPSLEFTSPEYRAVVSVFARLLQNSHGSLVRDDFNFTVGFFEDCRRITRQVDMLKVPALFKRSLREYYARTIIEQGEAKDYAAETRWLASLPQGQVVVAGPAAPHEPGVLYSERPDLDAMVALALPEFTTVADSQKPALRDALCLFNPNIRRRVVKSGGKKVDGIRQKTTQALTYEVAVGQPILVPSLRALEQFGRKEQNDQAGLNQTDADADGARLAQAGRANQ